MTNLTEEDKGFIRGVSYAIAEALRAGHEVLAEELIHACAIDQSLLRCAKVDSYDASPIRKVLKALDARKVVVHRIHDIARGF